MKIHLIGTVRGLLSAGTLLAGHSFAIAQAPNAPYGGCFNDCGTLFGCHSAKWSPYPNLPPNGSSVLAYTEHQVMKARLDRYFIHQFEWYLGGKTLGPFGRRHIRQLAEELAGTPGHVYLTPSESPALDGARLPILVRALKEAGLGDAEARVVLADSKAEGLFGEDAARIYPRLFMGNLGGGNMNNSGSGGFGGGFGGGSGGFGGGRGY